MERDNKIVLGAVLILLVGMLSFNFGALTGKASQNQETDAVLVATPQCREASGNTITWRSSDFGDSGKCPVKVAVSVRSGKINSDILLYKVSTGCSNSENCPPRKVEKAFDACTDTNCNSGNIQRSGNYLLSRVLEEGQYFFRAEAKESSGRDKVVFDSNVITIVQLGQGYRDSGDTPYTK